MTHNGQPKGPRLVYSAQELISSKIRKAPHVQKRLFCLRLYTAWIDSLGEGDLNKIVNQLIKQGHEFKVGKE